MDGHHQNDQAEKIVETSNKICRPIYNANVLWSTLAIQPTLAYEASNDQLTWIIKGENTLEWIKRIASLTLMNRYKFCGTGKIRSWFFSSWICRVICTVDCIQSNHCVLIIHVILYSYLQIKRSPPTLPPPPKNNNKKQNNMNSKETITKTIQDQPIHSQFLNKTTATPEKLNGHLS